MASLSTTGIMNNKKVKVFGLVAVLVIAGILAAYSGGGEEEPLGQATMADLIASTSEREAPQSELVVASDSSPFYALLSTPLAIYYEGSSKKVVPLLVAGDNESNKQDDPTSKSLGRFITSYGKSSAMVIGNIGGAGEKMGISASQQYPGNPKEASLSAAKEQWKSSDGAILVKDDQNGYSMAVPLAPAAAYLNIPIIVTDKVDSKVKSVLDNLGVKYTLICGDLKGYKKVWHFKTPEEAEDVVGAGWGSQGSVIEDRIGHKPEYIAFGNPADYTVPVVLDSINETFEGTVTSQGTGSTSDPAASPDAPAHYITIPSDFNFARVKMETWMKFSESPIPGRTPDLDGQRCYTYFGIDGDQDGVYFYDEDSTSDKLEFFVPSLAYESIRDSSGLATYAHSYSEEPIYNSPGDHIVQILATLHYMPENIPSPAPTTNYTIRIMIEKLEEPTFPLMHGISSLAPYLAAYREGMVLAREQFHIHSRKLATMNHSGDPAQDYIVMEQANQETFRVKNALNDLLARIADMPLNSNDDVIELANYYYENTVHVGIIADTNMVPWYLYDTSGQGDVPQEGYGVPGDIIYSDIDVDPEYPPYSMDGGDPRFELPVGRITGWDVQDVSSLLARTFFYNETLGYFQGHSGSWQESALTTFGDEPPVGFSKTVTTKLDQVFRSSGFSIDTRHDGPFSDVKLTQSYYEQSNLIYFCAHGFFYWYVPPGMKPTAVGGGFHVVNVKDMNFGPSILFASSCVTGKIDGLPPYNTLSQTFLHSGFNSYIGASRLSWGGFSPFDNPQGETYGDLVALFMYGYLTGNMYDKDNGFIYECEGDKTIGWAFMQGKTDYIMTVGLDGAGAHADTIEEFNLFGDPAFNPYIPNEGQ